MQVKLLAEGGSMKPGPALSQKLGPAGINIGEVIAKINEATSNFKGMKVPVELEINTTTKKFEITIFSPPISELLKKELGITKGSDAQNQVKVANASIEQIIKVAKTKLQNLLCKDLKSAVKTVVGSCVSLGILVENKNAKEIEQEIDEGKYDEQINGEITETPEEKKKGTKFIFFKTKSRTR
jgi:large subunit ribosomal protein L11